MSFRLPVRIVLIGSIALNVFLLVLLLMQGPLEVFRPFPPPPPQPRSPVAEMKQIAEHLPQNDAQVLLAAIEKEKASFEAMADIPKQLDQVRALLKAEPFDPDELDRVFKQGVERQRVFLLSLQSVVSAMATQASPEGRKIFADEFPPRPRPHRKDRRPPSFPEENRDNMPPPPPPGEPPR